MEKNWNEVCVGELGLLTAAEIEVDGDQQVVRVLEEGC